MVSRLKKLTSSSVIKSFPGTSSGDSGSAEAGAVLAGVWDARFEANGRTLFIEYSFLESGSGFEKISRSNNGKVLELHRYFWKLESDILKLVYITENMTEVQMRCTFRGNTCVLSDLETSSEELVLGRKTG